MSDYTTESESIKVRQKIHDLIRAVCVTNYLLMLIIIVLVVRL